MPRLLPFVPRSFVAFACALACAHAAAALPVSTRKGLVVSAHPAAARAGVDQLRAGGNAVDALVATAFALSVVEPHSSGLGGGGFALLYFKDKKELVALDFREIAPSASKPELYQKDGVYDPVLSRGGGLAVGVPGAVAGYTELIKRYGKRPLDKIVAPAIGLAKEGYILSAGHQRALKAAADMKALSEFGAKHFLQGTDTLGVRFKQPELGALLTSIAKHGADAFYKGPAAEALVRTVQASGGVMTTEDLAKYEVRPLVPIETMFRGHRVVTMPPPSAGGVTVLQTLGVLDRLQFPKDQYRSVDRLHALIEAWKRSYATRAQFMGDPRAEPDVVTQTQRLISPATLDAWAKSIGPKATPRDEISKIIEPIKEGPETTHISVVDAAGNVALMTTTINGPFGSGVVVPETGVVLNNEMDDFAAPKGSNIYGLVGGRYNAVAPGKTPLSTMAPTIVFDGDRPWIALGAPGGSTIATTIAQVVMHIVDEGMDVKQAVSAPRIHQQFHPEETRVEPYGMEDATRRELEARGQKLAFPNATWGNCQALTIEADGLRRGAADPRYEGTAMAEDQPR